MTDRATIDSRLAPIAEELIDAGITLVQARRAFEQKYLAVAIARCGNVTRAAQKVGVHRNTILNKAPSERALRERERKAREQMRGRR